MGIATSGPRRQPSHQVLTGSMSPSPARVRVSGAHAAVLAAHVEAEAEAITHRAIERHSCRRRAFRRPAAAGADRDRDQADVARPGPLHPGARRARPPHPRRRRRPTTAGVRDLGGRPFTIYKFRTMWVDAERATGAVWATQNDPRITPVGRFLRQYRLDELPQLLNVMRGEMNIVGPRPERPTIFAELREHIAEYPLPAAGQAGHHRAGADQPPLRPRHRRCPDQGALRPGVHPAPESWVRTSASCSRRSR